MSDGRLIFETLIDTAGIKSGLKNVEATTGEKLESIGAAFQRTGAIMTASLTTPIVLLGKNMVTTASDFDENLNKVDVAFKRNSAEVKAWSDTALESFGLSKNQALEMTSLFGDMSTSMGLGTKKAAALSTSLAGLAGDLASFKNKSIDEVQTALNGIFTGETESLKQLGIVMTQTNLDAFALAKGFNKTSSEMSQAELVMLRYEYVMEMAKNAHGDYARTADGTANSLRTFQGAVENLMIVLGQEVLPIFTPLVQNATDLMNAFANASPEVHKFAVKTLAAVAAAGPLLLLTGSITKGVGKLINAYTKLNKGVKFVVSATKAVIAYKTATEGASIAAGVMNGNLTKQQGAVGALTTKVGGLVQKIAGLAVKNPWTIAAVGAAGLAVAIYKIVDAQNAEVNAARDAAAARQKSVNNIKAESKEAEFYAQKLEELSRVENKTSSQKELMKQYVDRLNESVEGLNLTYDEETDKLNQTTDAIYKKIDAQKQEALEAAYTKNMKKAYEDYADAQMKAADAQTELNQKQEEWNNLTDAGKIANSGLQQEISELKHEVDQYNGSMMVALEDATKWANQSETMKTAWKQLKQDAKAAGIEIPDSLIQGINQGKYIMPTTIEELNALIDFNEAASKATGKGKEIVDNLRAQMLAGEMDIESAAKELSNTVDTELGKTPTKAGVRGSQTGQSYSVSLSNTRDAAETAALAVANAALNSAGMISLYTPGYNAGLGYASGLRGAIVAAATAAREIAAAALAAAKEQDQTHSPSERWKRELGEMDGEGYALGLMEKIPLLKKVGAMLPEAAFSAASNFDINGFGMPQPQSHLAGMGYAGSFLGNHSLAGRPDVYQTININEPVSTPAETARAIRNEFLFGLAGEMI